MIQLSTLFSIASIAITIISVTFAIVVGVSNMKRNRTADDKKEATEMTAVIVKLENISNDTKEIKNELRNIRNEVGELRERVVSTEAASKSLHKRVDNFERRLHDIEAKI